MRQLCLEAEVTCLPAQRTTHRLAYLFLIDIVVTLLNIKVCSGSNCGGQRKEEDNDAVSGERVAAIAALRHRGRLGGVASRLKVRAALARFGFGVAFIHGFLSFHAVLDGRHAKK